MTTDFTIPILWGVLLFCAGIGLWRVGKGPTTLDRMVGFDLITVVVMGMVLVFSVATQSTHYLEFIFILSGLGFMSTVAYFYYLNQRSHEDEDFKTRREP